MKRALRLLAKLARWALAATIILGALGVLAFFAIVRHYETGLPSVTDLKKGYKPPQVTRVLARDGSVLAELFTERRTVVPLGNMPSHLKLAVLAAEDAGFYEHEGLNYFGILRAMIVNLRSGRFKQGGSTITQQVVKNVLLDSEKSYRRKIREALLARRLEQELSKDDILELYLNHIYFGHGRYGIEEACRDSFGKPAKEISIAEAATLAGVVAGPELYSPRRHPERALERRAYVLGQMRAKGFLNDEQYERASREALRVAPMVATHAELAPEVVELARRMLQEVDPDRARLGGFTVHTTIDPSLQALARKSLRDAALQAYDKRNGLVGALHAPSRDGKKKGPKPPVPFEGEPVFAEHKIYLGTVVASDDAAGTFDVRVGKATGTIKLADFERYNPSKLAPSAFAPAGAIVRVSLLAAVPEGGGRVPLRLESGPEGALVAVDVRTRQVLALVGSYEGKLGGLDRSTQSRRQPGSTFKPIVYSYGIATKKFTPASLVDVSPDTFEGGYRPTNYEGWSAREPLRLRDALANSVNLVAVRVLREVGPANVVKWASSMGLGTNMKPDLSLALGSYEVSPLALAGAYGTFASGGVYETPYVVSRIVGPDGKDVPLKPRPAPKVVMDEPSAYITTSMMTSVVEHGTAAKAREVGRPVAGKTGTTNQAKDTWFAGFSADIVAVVWVGYDDGKPLGPTESGAKTALPAWTAFMKAAHEGRPKVPFVRPLGVETARIDKKTGKLALPDASDAMDEVFLSGTQPTEYAEPPDAGAPPSTDDASVGPESGEADAEPARVRDAARQGSER